ncbi:MAG TPA: 5-deoxy-glucuronate isomerase [Steroidobacteraceae bacterium]
MNAHITAHRNGFPAGFTAITRRDDADNPSGIGLAVLCLAAGEKRELTADGETAWLLMSGSVSGQAGPLAFALGRRSLFDESASCIHVAAGTRVTIQALTATELTVYDCANSRPFAPRVFRPEDVPNEPRGRGQVGDRALRYVRTIFDSRNSPPEVELVLGEVVTFPGGWSSYPPHHHPQHEIYHYRFTEPQGYGHAELGDNVVKVRQYDTVKIPAGLDHAQCAAPGYGMYYSWVIRHLPGKPYTVPEFTAEHAWTMQPGARFWQPRE